MNAFKFNESHDGSKPSRFAEVVLPSGCFSGLITAVSIAIGFVALFLLFPMFAPGAAYEYSQDPNFRLKGLIDLLCLIYVPILIFRIFLFKRFADMRSLLIVLRMNAFVGFFCALVVAVSEVSNPWLKTVILTSYIFYAGKNVFVHFKDKVQNPGADLIWSGLVLISSFAVLRTVGVLRI